MRCGGRIQLRNRGYHATPFEIMGVTPGVQLLASAEKTDVRQLREAERRPEASTKEARRTRRVARAAYALFSRCSVYIIPPMDRVVSLRVCISFLQYMYNIHHCKLYYLHVKFIAET